MTHIITTYYHNSHSRSLNYLLRFAILAVVIVSGAVQSWGQTIDFNLPNGYYYLGNQAGDNGVPKYDESTFSANYYMCPAYSTTVNEKNYLGGDPSKPLITTFKSFPNNGKTYSYAVWYIEAATGDNAGYFYIKHRDSGQYMVANDNSSPKTSRRRVNLGPISDPGDDALFRIQSDDDGATFYISSKTKADGDNKYLSPSNGNKDYLWATGDNSDTGGIIGFYKDKIKNQSWHFIPVPCDNPVITYDNTTNKVTITTTMEGADIHYTVDGTTTPTSSDGIQYNGEPFSLSSDQLTIKAVVSKTGYADSEVNTTTISLNPTITLSANSYTYDGSAREPDVSVEVIGNTVDASEYICNYSNNTNAGTATVTITDNAGGDYIVYGSTTFTIEPATLSITADAMTKGYGDPDPELTFTPTGIVAGDDVADVFTGTLTRVAGENVGTYAIGRGTLDISADNHNYEIGTFTPANFTITEKNIGNGTTPATGITADVTRNNDGTFAVTVRHGGNKLTAGTEGTEYDYSLTQNDTDPKYHVITVTGANNYTGSFVARYANVTFGKRAGETSAGGVATFVTNSSGDFDFATPANMTAYIVTAIDAEAGTVTAEALDYIPENVPVLLLSTVDAKGFQVKARSGGVNITPEQETANMLKKADVDKVLTTAQVYLLYKGEFVLNAAGTLPAGKVYLSKDGVALAPPVLDILWGTETGIEELTINKEQLTTDNGQLAIYDLQGRCVKTIDNGQLIIDKTQLPKGIYIVNGRKVVVR